MDGLIINVLPALSIDFVLLSAAQLWKKYIIRMIKISMLDKYCYIFFCHSDEFKDQST